MSGHDDAVTLARRDGLECTISILMPAGTTPELKDRVKDLAAVALANSLVSAKELLERYKIAGVIIASDGIKEMKRK